MTKSHFDAALAGDANKVGGTIEGAEIVNGTQESQVINKNNAEQCRFSVFRGKRRKDAPEPGGIRNKYPVSREMNSRQAYQFIKGPYAKGMTEEIRSLMAKSREAAERGDMETAEKLKAAANEVKSRLPYVTFGGIFTYCDTAHLVKYSGLMCFDIDKLTDAERMAEVRKLLLESEYFHTVLLFVSPRGEGLKWVVRIELGDYDYTYYYKAVQQYLLSIGIEADNTSDIARACFLCHDPNCYFAEGDDERERKTFIPEDWLANGQNVKNVEHKGQLPTVQQQSGEQFAFVERTPEQDAEVDNLVQRLVERRIDITDREPDWFKLALSFASYYGREADFDKSIGLHQFLSISQFYPRFTVWETRNKYLHALNRDQNYKRELAGMSEEQRAKRMAENPIITINYFIVTAKLALDPIQHPDPKNPYSFGGADTTEQEPQSDWIEEIFNDLNRENDEEKE